MSAAIRREPPEPVPAPFLAAREQQALVLLGAGNTERETATVMHISRSAVRNHLNHIGHRIGVRRGPALIAKAIRLGLLTPAPAPGDEQIALDPRERSLVALLAELGTEKAVARRLGESVREVHEAFDAARRKLGAGSANALIWRAAAVGAWPGARLGIGGVR